MDDGCAADRMDAERTDTHKKRQAGKVALGRKGQDLGVNTRSVQDQIVQKTKLKKDLTAELHALAEELAKIAAAREVARAREAEECKTKAKKLAARLAAGAKTKAEGVAGWTCMRSTSQTCSKRWAQHPRSARPPCQLTGDLLECCNAQQHTLHRLRQPEARSKADSGF